MSTSAQSAYRQRMASVNKTPYKPPQLGLPKKTPALQAQQKQAAQAHRKSDAMSTLSSNENRYAKLKGSGGWKTDKSVAMKQANKQRQRNHKNMFRSNLNQPGGMTIGGPVAKW
jgi:hypothetical protein